MMKGITRSAIGIALSLSALATMAWPQSAQILPTLSVFAGSYQANGYSGDGGPATSATFSSTLNTASPDPYGNVYIADTGNNVIRKVDANGIITTVAGGATAVCAGATNAIGDGCPATQATLNGPLAARYYNGNLYIADNNNNEVRVVNGVTGIITSYLGAGGTSTSTAAALATQFNIKNPQDITFDRAGNMYALAAGGKPWVVRVDAATQMATLFAGTGAAGIVGDGGLATKAKISTPEGVVTDAAGNVYIGNKGSSNDVREVTISTGIMSTYVGISGVNSAGSGGDGGPSDAKVINAPQHLAMDQSGNLYIADTGNHSIRLVLAPTGGATYGTMSTVAGSGATSGSADGQLPNNAALVNPYDAEPTPGGDLLITDEGASVVYIARPAGTFGSVAVGTTSSAQTIYALTQQASGTFTVAGSDFAVGTTTCAASTTEGAVGTLCSATLTFKPSAAGRRKGVVIFTDTANAVATSPLIGIGMAAIGAILPGQTATVAGTGTAGSAGDGGTAAAAQLNGSNSAVVDNAGNIYIADTANDTVREISATTGDISTVAGTAGSAGYSGDGAAATAAQLNAPSALAIDGAGNLYIADTGNNRVRVVNALTGVISTFAGGATTVCATSINAIGDGCLATQSTLSAPSGLAFTKEGDVLYIADTGDNVIRAVGMRNDYISTQAGTGAADTTGDGGQANQAALHAPTGVAVDNADQLYIADTGNNRVRIVTANGLINNLAGQGGAGAYTPDGPAASIQLDRPTGIAVDAAGDVYVSDTNNNRVGMITGGNFITVAGTGNTAGFSGDGGLSNAAAFYQPTGLALDAEGNLYVADTGNNRLRSINVNAVTLGFPKTSPNATSTPLSVALYNTGNETLNVASATVTTPYTQSASGGTDCGSNLALAPSSACQLQIVFAPTAIGSYPGTVTVTDNAQGQTAATQTISLTGVAAPVFVASFTTGLPANVTGGSNQTVTIAVTSPGQTYTGTLTFSSSDPLAVLPPPYTYTAADAAGHTFTGIQFKTGGQQTLTVTDSVTAPPVTATISTVVVPSNGNLTISSGNNQTADIFTGSYTPLVVAVTDGNGNPIPGVNVTFTVQSSSGATATFSSGGTTATATTGSTGLAGSVPLAPNQAVGTFTVQASVPGLAPVNFTLQNTSTIPTTFTLTPNLTDVYPRVFYGGTATVPVSIAAEGGFFGTVNFTCTAPANSTCSVAPGSLPITMAQSGQITLKFTSTAPTTASSLASTRGTLALALLLGIGGLAFRRRRFLSLTLLLLASLVTVTATGCGGSAQVSSQYVGGYPVVLTGTSGGITQSVNVNFYVSGK